MFKRLVFAAALTAAVGAGFPIPVNAQLFTISGTVTDTFNAPVPSVDIKLFDAAGNPIGILPTQTDLSGIYSIVGLPAGTYGVGFEPDAIAKLLPATVDSVLVTSNTTVDATLDPGNLVSGFVRDSTGVGIFNIDLKVEDKDTGVILNTPDDNTDSTGFYAIVVPDGEFIITWRAVDPFLDPWIPVEIREFILGDSVFDITMIIGVFVSGTVFDETLTPVLNVNLDFIDSATGVKFDAPGGNTGLIGSYQAQVPLGVYDVVAKPDPIDRLLGAQKFGVPIFGDTVGVDFALFPGISVSGNITGPGAVPVLDVDIDVRDAETGAGIFTPFDKTDLLGHYEVIVPGGVHHLIYQPPIISVLAPVQLTAVSVSQDTIIDLSVPNGVLLSGQVLDDGALGVPGVDIDAERTVSGFDVPLAGDITDATGAFTVVVEPGLYNLEFEPPPVLRLVAKRLPNTSATQDTMVSCTLDPGVSVSGLVTDQVGTFFSGVRVRAFKTVGGEEIFTPGASTSSLGRYEVIIPPANYSLLYKPDPLTGVDSIQLDNVPVGVDTVVDIVFPVSIATGIDDTKAAAPGIVSLYPNYPNPFNPSTTIRYEIGGRTHVKLAVYDVAGSLIKTLFDGTASAGVHEVYWHGENAKGQRVSTGVYFYRLSASHFATTRKMVLLK